MRKRILDGGRAGSTHGLSSVEAFARQNAVKAYVDRAMANIRAAAEQSGLYPAVELFRDLAPQGQAGARGIAGWEARSPGFRADLKKGLEAACEKEHFTVSLVDGPDSEQGAWYALVRPNDTEFEA